MAGSFRFLHAADLHLDSPFTFMSTVPESVRRTVRESTFQALRNLTDLAIREKVDFVLFAGDVFDLADRSLKAQLRFLEAMERLDEHGILSFVVYGNHDPADGEAARLTWPKTVRFLSSERAERVPIVLQDGRGHVADLYGMSYPTAAVRDNLALKIGQLARAEGVGSDTDGVYRIGLLHANVDQTAGYDNYAPCSLEDLLGAGLDYWALGHVHGRKVLHETPHVVYPGNLQGRNVRETGEKGCYLVEVEQGGQTKLVFCPLDAVRWHAAELSIDGLDTEQDWKDRAEQLLDGLRREAGGRPVVVRLDVTGRGVLHRSLQKSGLLQEWMAECREMEAERADVAGDFVWIESVRLLTGPLLDREALKLSDGFLGDLLRLADELLQDDGKLAAFAERCLNPLLSNPKAAQTLGSDGGSGEGGPGSMAGLPPAQVREWLLAAVEMAMDDLAAEGEGG